MHFPKSLQPSRAIGSVLSQLVVRFHQLLGLANMIGQTILISQPRQDMRIGRGLAGERFRRGAGRKSADQG